jgi:afadin
MLPNKMQATGGAGSFMRESQSQHSLRMNQQQQQMMAPSMPNIAHASGFANNIPASQSMQNVNQMPGSYQMYHPQQQQQSAQFQELQQFHQNPQLSPNQQLHQASLLRGSAKMAEMGEMLKRQQRNQQLPNGVGPQMHFANSMDNINSMHIPTNNNNNNNATNNPMMSPSGGGGHRQSAQQNFQPQSPQKLLPPTAPKPQVCTTYHT